MLGAVALSSRTISEKDRAAVALVRVGWSKTTQNVRIYPRPLSREERGDLSRMKQKTLPSASEAIGLAGVIASNKAMQNETKSGQMLIERKGEGKIVHRQDGDEKSAKTTRLVDDFNGSSRSRHEAEIECRVAM